MLTNVAKKMSNCYYPVTQYDMKRITLFDKSKLVTVNTVMKGINTL